MRELINIRCLNLLGVGIIRYAAIDNRYQKKKKCLMLRRAGQALCSSHKLPGVCWLTGERGSCPACYHSTSPGSSYSLSDPWCVFTFQQRSEARRTSLGLCPSCGFQLVLTVPHLASILASQRPTCRHKAPAQDTKATSLQRLCAQLMM